MAEVRVDLGDSLKIGDVYKNHRPEFRPVDSDKLYGSERTLASAVNKIAQSLPVNLLVDYIYGRVTARALTSRISELVMEDPEMLERPVYAAFQSGAQDAADQQRRDVNAVLRRLGSPVMLRSAAELRKAKREVLWETDLSTFDRSDPNAPGRIYSRFRSQEILTDLSSTVQASIEATVGNAFTVTQQFQTGRTATGLTSQQTAQTIYAILDETSPTTPTGADLAARYVPHTRGLNTRYTTAVINHGNAVAYQQIQAGQTPSVAMRLADRSMERYGEKLRRSRARMIARTEIAYAQNAGIQHQHQLMIDSGVASPDSLKEWVTGPFDVCDICVPLGGTTVPVAGEFFWKNGSGNPPAHPNCRCKTRLRPSIAKAPQRIGAGTEDDPYRYQFDDGWEAPVDPSATRPRPRRKPAETVEPGPQPTLTREQYEAGGSNDSERAATVYRNLGYDAPPKVVGDLTPHIDRSPTDQLSRAVTGVYDGATETMRASDEIAEAFRTGKMFWGEGISGSGVYTIEGSEELLQEYLNSRLANLGRAVQSGDATVLRMTAKPDAKVLTATRRELEALVERTGIVDEMVAAASEGYDMVRVVKGDNVEVVVLNRGSIIVERAP